MLIEVTQEDFDNDHKVEPFNFELETRVEYNDGK